MSVNRLANYNPGEVDAFYGPVKLAGFAEGEFITVDQDEDTFFVVVGVDGEAARSLNENDMTTVSVKLLQTSETNTVLSELLNLDILTKGRAPQTFLLKDKSGFTVWASPIAFILKPPSMGFDKQAKEREWKFKVMGQPPTNVIGGN